MDTPQIMQAEIDRPEPYAELDQLTLEQKSERDEYIEKMRAGLAAAILHRQHYFAYRRKANPATMLRVAQWAMKRMSAVSVWKTKGAVR